MTTEKEQNYSEQQAVAQLESIVEMVRALDRETAAEDYARNLSREKCVELLTEAGIECRDEETVETLREAVAANVEDQTIEPDDFEFDEEEARETIEEDPLEITVRTDWFTPGQVEGDAVKPAEFCILLCTGGPAVRIIGDLDEHLQPDSARLQHQDWGTPWTEYLIADPEQREALLTYCQQFYYGE